MEPVSENSFNEPQVQKSVFFRVTPFSKYLALLLFISLPFIGGWIGYKYSPEKVVEKVVMKEVQVEEKNEVPDFSSLDYIECFNSKDYFVVAPRYGSELEFIIVKNKSKYTDILDCEYSILDGDIKFERYSPSSVKYLANKRLYIDSGTSKIRGISVFDIVSEEFVLVDSYIKSHEMETSADFVRYWSVADDEMGPNDCVDINMEEWGNWGVGLNKYVEYNFATREETVIESECARRE